MTSRPNAAERRPLKPAPPLSLPPETRPHLFVVVDTEEEFDWGAPFARANTGVAAMSHIGRSQAIFDRFGIKPIYVMDYPVATQRQGYEPLLEFRSGRRCEIGAHLHPWVTPPYDEPVTGPNSFTCNLDRPLQRAKIGELVDVIEARFGERPRIFKAGRYGLDAVTVEVLDELGFELDNSVSPRMNFSSAQGPSFAAFDVAPFFLTPRLLEFPCTIDYVGWLGALRPAVHRVASTPRFESLRAVGVLNRLGAVNRIMLSPESSTFEEMRSLTNSLLSRGCRTFTFSFHSPSVEPGHTPYVRTRADLERFLGTIERFCEFFMGQAKGVAPSPHDFRASLLPAMGFAS